MLSVEVTGNTFGDLELALQEVTGKVSQGYLSGMDSNDTGRFYFQVEGEEEEKEDE